MAVIVLDAGHGGVDPGASANGLNEKDITLNIVNKIGDLLSAYDVTVKKTRDYDKYVSLTNRCKCANNLNADLFVSVHVNAGGGKGYETYIHTSVATNAKHKQLQTYFHKQNVFKDRGKKAADFQVLRDTKMSAILTENGFIDNKSDVVTLKIKINEIAQFHTNAIVNYLGLKKKDQTVYYVKTGTVKGMSEATKVANNIKNLGYLATIVKA